MVITGLTRNQFVGNGTWVRIPPAPPQKKACFTGFFLLPEFEPKGSNRSLCTFLQVFFSRKIIQYTDFPLNDGKNQPFKNCPIFTHAAQMFSPCPQTPCLWAFSDFGALPKVSVGFCRILCKLCPFSAKSARCGQGQAVFHRLRRTDLGTVIQVGVDIGGSGKIAVPEPLLNLL